MECAVSLFAGLRERAGRAELTVELEASARVADLRRAVEEACPALVGQSYRVAQDAAYLDEDATLATTGEVALIPPVSGG